MQVISVERQVTEVFLEVSLDNGEILRLSKPDALKLAVQLAFMADSNLTRTTSEKGVLSWNTNSKFHKLYGDYMLGRWRE